MTIFGAIILFVVVGVVGVVSNKFMGDDNAVEEVAEAVIEEEVEDFAGLPEDSMRGKIDFTPSSEEDK